MAGPATSAGDEDAVGDGVALDGAALDADGEADGVVEDSDAAGEALVVAAAAVATTSWCSPPARPLWSRAHSPPAGSGR